MQERFQTYLLVSKLEAYALRNEDEPIQPGEFRDVDAPAGSLRDAIQPLPFKEPSATLLNLLGLIGFIRSTFCFYC